jgi:ABC-type nitrate/sulfonate/bicarbonate transport system substrate-binding protein
MTGSIETRGATAGNVDLIRLGGGAAGFNWLPVYLAERKGAFAKRGLKVEIHKLGSVDKATAAVKARDVDIAITPPEGAIKDAAASGDLRIIASNAVRLPLTLVARPQHKKIEDLRGGKLGTSSMTEGTALYTMEMLRKHGLNYPGEYEFAVVGVHPARWKALQEGTIDAAVQPPPFNFLAIDAGYSNFGEVSDYVPDILFTAVICNRSWAQANRRTVTAFLRALSDATQWFYDPAYDAELIALAAEIAQADGEHARQTVEYLRNKQTFMRDLSIPPAAFAKTLELMKKAGVADDALLSRAALVIDESYRQPAG